MKNLLSALVLSAACAAQAALPKVIVMVDEKALGSISTSEVETMAVAKLSEKDVETVDRNMVQSNIDRLQKVFRSAGDNRAAAAMGREFGADVILIGEAVSKPNATKIGDSNLRSYNASVSFRAVRVDNAVNLASVSETATVIAMDDVSGSSKALKAAAGKALDSIVPAMLTKWEKPNAARSGNGGKTALELAIGGMDQIWKLKEMRLRLKAMPKQVASVQQKSYAQGVAIFRIESLLPAEELAEELVMNPPEGLRVQIVEIRETTINLRVAVAPKEEKDDE